MNMHQIPSEGSPIPPESFDHHDARKEEYAPNTYAQEFRWLGSHAIDPVVRDEYYRLAEMFE